MRQVVVFRSDHVHSLSDIDHFPNTPVSIDWFGNTVLPPLEYCLVVDPEMLHFCFTSSEMPQFDENRQPNDFVEGLWKQDVAELFLCDDATEAYQEFNLAPSGAWWSQRFSAYRAEDPKNFSMPEELRTTAEVTEEGWQASLSLPLSELSVNCSFSATSRLNVCSIFGENPRVYCSVCDLSPAEPDFHCAAGFNKISVVAGP